MREEWGGGKICPRAVATVVLPEEVGPERARRRGGLWMVGEEEEGEVEGCVLLGLDVGGWEDVGLESAGVGMVVGREGGGGG